MTDSGTGYDRHFEWRFYWNVDIPGLTEGQARSLVSLSNERYGTHGRVVDPRQWLTLHLDRETAEVLRDSLLAVSSTGVGAGLREIVGEWLDSTETELRS